MEQKYFGIAPDDTYFRNHSSLVGIMIKVWFDVCTGEEYEIERYRFDNDCGCYVKIEIEA